MNDAFGIPQSVVVLGGTSAIAGAVVDLLVAGGCRTVVLAGRDPAALARRAEAAVADGALKAPTILFEALAPNDARRCVEACFAAAEGDVDLVLVAVGALGDQQEDEQDGTRTADALAVNLTWPAAALAEVGVRLRAQGHGRIVVLSSVAGVRIRRSNFTYGAAKAGIDGIARGMAESLRGTGVVVQVIRPGFVHTRMTAGRTAAPFAVGPAQVAAAIVDGLSGNRPVIWVPPVLRWVFAVLVHLPQGLWRRLPG